MVGGDADHRGYGDKRKDCNSREGGNGYGNPHRFSIRNRERACRYECELGGVGARESHTANYEGKQMKKTLTGLVLTFALILTGCGPSSARELKIDLDKAAKILNTAAKTNHQLWVSGVYGAGEAGVAVRKKVATVIHTANDDLIAAIDFAKTITDANFATNKARVKTMLQGAANTLSATVTGNAQIDALIQSAALLINSAVALTARMEKRDVLPYIPEIREWSEQFRMTMEAA